jgi:MFS family permease
MPSLTYRELIAGNRPFRRLLAGQVVSELGNWFNFIAGLGLVRAVSGAAPTATATLVVLQFAPLALFMPVAGAVVDRLSRRRVMIWTDALRAVVALGFLFVGGADDLWIAYACTLALGILAAFFEGAKNAALPNVVGPRGLLAGTALMFSSRFLLMSVGAALGGAAAAVFGYKVAFAINAVSFAVSAYTIWLIPEGAVRAAPTEGTDAEGGDARAGGAAATRRAGYLSDVAEGWRYIARHRLVAAIVGLNIIWAVGGGALNLVYDRLGGVVFAGQGGLGPDASVSFLYAAVGLGLFVGMMLARRVGAKVELRRATAPFIGWMVIAHGVLFALAGVMPSLWLAALFVFLSRAVIGVEFAVQETLLARLLPDSLRGRVQTTDRAAEIMTISLTTVSYGWLLGFLLTPRSLTVVSGLLSGLPGLLWLLLFAADKLRIPESAREDATEGDEGEAAALASAG